MEEQIGEQPLTKKEKRALAKDRRHEEGARKQTAQTIKKFAIWIGVLALIGFLGYKFVNFINTPTSNGLGSPIEIVESDHVKGKSDAKVTLVEYGDYQCPACRGYAEIVNKLSDEFPDQLRVVYRHFPLTQIHKNALPSAKAAEAAHLQGNFWEMHDLLYDKQEEWSELGNARDKFIEYAGQIGLDSDKFAEDYDNADLQKKIDSDLLSGNQIGVNSTPTFILNNRKLVAPRGYDQFKKLIEEEIAK